MRSSLEIPTDSNAFNNFRNRNETELTYNLKWAAWKWLWEVAGCRVIGFEVRLEGPFGRVADVVGLGPENRVYLVEVKSSRADLRRDDNNERTREKLVAKSKSLERAVELTQSVLSQAAKGAEGPGRNDDSSGKNSRAVAIAEADARTITKKSESTKKRIEILSVKFHDSAYLRCADYHYIMAPHRMVRITEIPDQWGLLNERSETVVEAPLKQVKRVTQHVLRAIARAEHPRLDEGMRGAGGAGRGLRWVRRERCHCEKLASCPERSRTGGNQPPQHHDSAIQTSRATRGGYLTIVSAK